MADAPHRPRKSLPRLPNDVIGRSLSDPGYRKRLIQDPAGALREHGYPELAGDQELLDAIRGIDLVALEKILADLKKLGPHVPEPFWI